MCLPYYNLEDETGATELPLVLDLLSSGGEPRDNLVRSSARSKREGGHRPLHQPPESVGSDPWPIATGSLGVQATLRGSPHGGLVILRAPEDGVLGRCERRRELRASVRLAFSRSAEGARERVGSRQELQACFIVATTAPDREVGAGTTGLRVWVRCQRTGSLACVFAGERGPPGNDGLARGRWDSRGRGTGSVPVVKFR